LLDEVAPDIRLRLRDVEIQLVEMMSMQQLEALRTGPGSWRASACA
jgi:hypothetical protein